MGAGGAGPDLFVPGQDRERLLPQVIVHIVRRFPAHHVVGKLLGLGERLGTDNLPRLWRQTFTPTPCFWQVWTS